ncbi:MAG: GNAT family N-acetyltransferase [Anaerolineales bacterium]|nr:GNAT family N-acetyltransferase [Anaerolineales bacterium]
MDKQLIHSLPIPLTEKPLLRSFLEQNRALYAYGLGNLELLESEVVSYNGVFVDNQLDGVALLWRGEVTPVLVLCANETAAHALLTDEAMPHQVHVMTPANLQPALETHFSTLEVDRLWRMAVTAPEFERAAPRAGLRRLTVSDLDAVNALYRAEHIIMSAQRLTEGVFYGFEDKNQQLIAIAGTHAVAPSVNIGIVGSVYTTPEARGQGLATLTTGAVTEELFRLGIDLVALNVLQTNTPAIRAYQKLGYRIHAPIIKGIAYKEQ